MPFGIVGKKGIGSILIRLIQCEIQIIVSVFGTPFRLEHPEKPLFKYLLGLLAEDKQCLRAALSS